MGRGTYIWINTLNVNGLNAHTKRHKLAEWIQNKTRIYAVYKRPTSDQGHIQTESEGIEKYIHSKWKSKKAGVAILISDKIDFKIKTITRDKEEHYIMMKGSIQEEDITIVNIYATNIGAPQYIKQILTAIKGEIVSNTIIIGDFNTPLSPMDRSSKMKKIGRAHV